MALSPKVQRAMNAVKIVEFSKDRLRQQVKRLNTGMTDAQVEAGQASVQAVVNDVLHRIKFTGPAESGLLPGAVSVMRGVSGPGGTDAGVLVGGMGLNRDELKAMTLHEAGHAMQFSSNPTAAPKTLAEELKDWITGLRAGKAGGVKIRGNKLRPGVIVPAKFWKAGKSARVMKALKSLAPAAMIALLLPGVIGALSGGGSEQTSEE